MKKSTQKVFESLGWTLAMLLLPVLGLIFWILRMRNLKKKNPETKRGYLWGGRLVLQVPRGLS